MAHILDASLRHRNFDAQRAEMALKQMKRLERLDLSHNDIERPPRLPSSLISLNLSHNPRCQQLSGFAVSNLDNLRELILTNNDLGSTSGLSHLTSLEILDLGNNSIRQLTGLELLSELKVLVLVQNCISSVTALRCLSCNYNLESLDLRGNPVCKSNKYTTVRNIIGESLSEMDGKMIKAQKFVTNKAAHSSSVDDAAYLYYARGEAAPSGHRGVHRDKLHLDTSYSMRAQYTSIEERASPERFRVLRMNSQGHNRGHTSPPKMSTTGLSPTTTETHSHRALLTERDSPIATASTGATVASSGSGARRTSSAVSIGGSGNGYRAQYSANSIQKQEALHNHNMENSQVSIAGGFALNPDRQNPGVNSYLDYFNHQSRLENSHHGRSQTKSGVESGRKGHYDPKEDERQYIYNGDGLPSSRKVTSRDGGEHSVSYYNPPAYNQRHVEGPESKSKMLTWYHLQRKSPLPWRNAPDVKPRPWKGLHYEDEGGGANGWTAVVSEQGKHMRNETPWVSPVTVVAYERNPQVVSNGNYYKRIQMRKQQEWGGNAGVGPPEGGVSSGYRPTRAEIMQQYGLPRRDSASSLPSAREKREGQSSVVDAGPQYDEDEVFYASALPPGGESLGVLGVNAGDMYMHTPGMTPVNHAELERGDPESSLDYSLSLSRASSALNSPARSPGRAQTSHSRRRSPARHRPQHQAHQAASQKDRNTQHVGPAKGTFEGSPGGKNSPTRGINAEPHYLQPTFGSYAKTSPVREKFSHNTLVGSPDDTRTGWPQNPYHMSHASLIEQMHNDPAWAAFQAMQAKAKETSDKGSGEAKGGEAPDGDPERMSPLQKLALMELYGDSASSTEWAHNVVDAPPSPPSRNNRHDSEMAHVVPAPQSGASSDPNAPVEETLLEILTELYSAHSPDKLPMLPTIIETFAGRERDLVVRFCDKFELDQRTYLQRLTRALEAEGEVSYVSASSANDDSRLSVHESQIYVSNVYVPTGAPESRAGWDGKWFVEKEKEKEKEKEPAREGDSTSQDEEEEMKKDKKPALEVAPDGEATLHHGWWNKKTQKFPARHGTNKDHQPNGKGGTAALTFLQKTLEKVG